ncbi:hypothetical protein [Gaopeijia maritima]|uniref:LppX_LprAFG lipoprotein n=1 Tax=Gaopeijia maritima TaxID=3119007 RepID=A0ABU9E6G5_9BACT
MRRATVWVWVSVALAGCGGGESSADSGPEGPAVEAVSFAPRERFVEVERMLLDAAAVEMDFEVAAEGAIEVALTGRLVVDADGRASLRAEGVFAGAPTDVMLSADAEEMRYGATAAPTEGPALPALREALLVGLTRMGVLHNIARLTAGLSPDHADGGVSEWVVVDAFAEADPDSGAVAVAFDLTVAGEPSGSATLALDGEGHPLVRRQTVAFPDGEMRVTERYSAVRVVH